MKDNDALTTLDLPALTVITGSLIVRARPRPRSADRARSRAHRAEPRLLLIWRVATRASGCGKRGADNPESGRLQLSKPQEVVLNVQRKILEFL